MIFAAAIVLTGLVSIQAPQPALAEIYNEPDDDDDLINPYPPNYQAPPNGFVWSVPARYGGDWNNDLMVDTYWRVASIDYDPNYIYPEHWPMNFNGCQTVEDLVGTGTNTYQWNIEGTNLSGGCVFSYNFHAQGTYPITMTVTASDGSSTAFPQEVYIKDYFIAAIGDSLASGEGNPDIHQRFNGIGLPSEEAKWQDKRCHRSADAYPSQAAIALELSDPHSSVTFISFACSGATILTPQWDPYGLQLGWPPLNLHPDPSLYRGMGILDRYIGTIWDDHNIITFLPSQIDQLQTALERPGGGAARQFDALIISAGGNDLHFGDIASTCLFEDNCWPNSMVFENSTTEYNMSALINRALTPHAANGSPTSIPDSLSALATAVNNLDPKPTNVYITQYADQTRGDVAGDPSVRRCSLLFDIFWPLNYGATPQEAGPLAEIGLWGLDQAIETIAGENVNNGWQYIDGITTYEVDPNRPHGAPGMFQRDDNGNGHGYCAADNWIVRADESEIIQGPWGIRLINKGTLHPNGEGIQAMKERLLYYMLPDLESSLPGNPPGDPPVFSSSFTSNGLTSRAGENGWYTGSCDANQNCTPDQVVLQVTATGTAPLEAANMYLNGQEGCTISGISCPTTYITDTNQLIWDFSFGLDGIYHMQFSARDSNDQLSEYVADIKVDLYNPYFDPMPGPYSVDEGDSVTLTAVPIDQMSAIINLDWDLDNDGSFETTAEQPNFSAADLDGPTSRTVVVRATDEAGWATEMSATVNVLNVDPSVEILGAPATEEEGTSISLTSSVTDPGTADTFTYAWEVTKNGTSYASGSEADFAFTPDDNGSYVVSLSATDDDGGVGTTSQTIVVTNVAPVLSSVAGSATSINEAGTFTLTGDISDPGTADTFGLTIDWGDGSTPELVSLPAGSTDFSVEHVYADDDPTGTSSDTYQTSLSLEDDDGGTDTGSPSVVVNNLPPSVTITTPENGALYAVNTTVSLSASVTDPSTLDTLSCSVSWADGTSQPVTLAGGLCSASHVFSQAGVYAIQMTATDDDSGEKTESVMAVVYDPSAGFVTGGGWILSPAGAYKANVSLTGKASFGFVSKYLKGAIIPTGNTAFAFDVAGMAFASQSYEWLVVNQSGTNAQFKGSGTVNGLLDPNGNAYKFMLWASDGSPDTFRIRIWYEDASGQHDVYDNGVSQAIGGGNIVVHTGK